MRNKLLTGALSMESTGAVEFENKSYLESSLALESAALEIEEAGNSLEMMEFQNSELQNAATSLESICQSIESSLESDEAGLTQGAAKGYTLAVEAVLGGALPNPVASLESFGGDTERREATELSMESISDTIKKIWDAIKRTVQKVIKAVSDFFSKLFGGVKKAKKKAEELQKKLKDMKNPEAKEKTFKSAGLSSIALDGKVDKGSIMKGLSTMSVLTLSSASMVGIYLDYLKEVVGYFKAKKEETKEIEYAVKKANEDLRKEELVAKQDELPGGKVIIAADSEKSDKGLPSLISPELTDHPKAKSYKADKDGIDALSTSDIENVLKSVIGSLESIEKSEKQKLDMAQMQESALSQADRFAQEVERGKLGFVEESWDRVKLRWVLSRAKGGMSSFVSKVDRYSFSVARAYLSLADSAIDNLQEKDAG